MTDTSTSATPTGDALARLDDRQRDAVTAPPGLVAVIAAAGSGKTTVLAQRIVHRIASGTADARHTVAITFTRDAAWELRRRLHRERLHDQVIAGTFHATAFGLLRQRWADQGRPVPAVVADRRRLVAEAMGETPRGRRAAGVGEVSAEIDWARARLVTPQTYEAEARASGRSTSVPRASVAETYKAYETLKQKHRVIDLDDLLVLMLDMMERDPGYADVVRWRYRHLHLDEAQDLNPLQHAVLEAWRGGRDDLFLVGDPAQSIYGWNGAESRLMLDVDRMYPGITIVRLDRNFRSSPQVVRTGIHLLAQTDLPTTIAATRPDGPNPQLFGFADEEREAAGVARLVRSARPPGGRYRAIGVLVRTNAQAVLVASHLVAVGVPVRVRRGRGHVERALGEASSQGGVHALVAWAGEVLADPPVGRDDHESNARRQVAAVVDQFVSDTGGGTGRDFASWVRSTDAVSEGTDDTDGVEVLTFHAAKGREWSTVVVAGFEQRLVPHSSARSTEQKAEEIRLAYVAVTRCISNLFITWAEERSGRRTGRSTLLAGLSLDDDQAVPAPIEVVDLLASSRSPDMIRKDGLMSALTEWRRSAARAAAVPEAVVCSDDELRRLTEQPIESEADLAEVLGAMTAHHHAARLLPLFANP